MEQIEYVYSCGYISTKYYQPKPDSRKLCPICKTAIMTEKIRYCAECGIKLHVNIRNNEKKTFCDGWDISER